MLAMASIITVCNGKPQPSKKHAAKVLVAYFSCTGHTERAAQRIAQETGGDLYRITPAQPYTSADLNWQNDRSRSSVEMKNPQSRPALSTAQKANIAAYTIIYIGYPIWWGTHPTIINSFLEAYDFSGKQVIPFVTSGGSSIDKSEASLRQNYKNINWGKGLLINREKQDLSNWINGNTSSK